MEQSFFSDRDIVLTEGFKKGDKPKIAVLTKGQEEQLLKEIEGSILATVGEGPVRSDLPHFKADDSEGLVQMLEDRFLKESDQTLYQGHPGWKKYPFESFCSGHGPERDCGNVIPFKRI